MKSYTYTAIELGLKKLPPGELRLTGFEKTTDPSQADVFIIPCDLRHVTNEQIRRLPYLSGNEARHAVLCVSDRWDRCLGLPFISFRCDACKGIVAGDPTTIPWAWPVNPQHDIDRFNHPPRDGFKYDVCFVGWASTPLTNVACQSVKDTRGLSSFFELNREFYGTWESNHDTEKIEHYRFLMLDTMHNSRLSLCARSIAAGVVRYRFYEAMAMGRVPVHLNDHRVLPFARQIDWDCCSIHIPEKDAPRTGEILRTWLDHHTDGEILEMGQYGRKAWEVWLAGEKWEELFGWCAKERLAGRL